MNCLHSDVIWDTHPPRFARPTTHKDHDPDLTDDMETTPVVTPCSTLRVVREPGSTAQGFHCLQNGAFNNSRCLRGARTVPSATESGNSVGFSRRASCDTTPESPWARDVRKTKSAPNTRFARCVIRLNPACNRTPHRVGKRCLFDATNPHGPQINARLSKRARPVLGSIPSLDVSMRVICTALSPITSHMTHPCGRASVIICERGAVAGRGRVI